jgi:acetolactate synthase-1/2/3 large subunit
MARGEAGAGNMADACARSTSAWACASPAPARRGQHRRRLVEAYTAGTPLLHITGQIETPYLDRSCPTSTRRRTS